MSSGALVLLISLSIGQTDGVPILDEVFQSSPDRPPPPGERMIRVIQHPDRDFKLAGALRLRIGVDAAILSAEYETDTVGAPKSAFELGDDLGIHPVALALKSEVEFRPFKMLHLRVGGSWAEWDGDERLESDLRFGRVDFPAGSNTATDFRLLETHVYLGHELGRWSRGHHGYLIGARYFQTELRVQSDGGGPSERNRIEGAMPVIGYSGGLSPFDGLELRAQISLFSLSLGSGNEEDGLIQVDAIEIQVGLEFSLLPWLDIEAGYLFGDLILRRKRDGDEEMVEVSTHRLGVWGSIRF